MSRVALVGFGGVGKSQLAIEYCYRTREASPATWVLWAHASSAARLEQSFREIANCVKIQGRQDPQVNIFQLVHDWLCNAEKQWLLVLDNVDDAGFLCDTQATSLNTTARPLREYIPWCEYGSVLVTTRHNEAALQLVEQRDTIALDPMNAAQAQTLLAKKLGAHAVTSKAAELFELATVLEFMPLALIQAAAYISQRAPLCSVAQYLDQFRKSERRRTSLLSYDKGQLRRDYEAKNSIITTWQISFDYLQQIRPSAADLLSLMSFFDRQGIPENVLRKRRGHVEHEVYQEINDTEEDRGSDGNSAECDCDDGDVRKQPIYLEPDAEEKSWNAAADDLKNNNSEEDDPKDDYSEDDHNEDDHNEDDYNEDDRSEYDNSEDDDSEDDDSEDDDSEDDSEEISFLEDVTTLRNFRFISVSTDAKTFEMHALVQLSMRTWLAANGELERYKEQFIRNLDEVFPTGVYETWPVCQVLFSHAKAAISHKPEAKASLLQWASLLHNAAWYALHKGSASEAEILALQSLKVRKKILGQEHEYTIRTKSAVSNAYEIGGKWKAAEELAIQVMETCRKTLGADHLKTLTSMHNLALIYENQGRFEEAEKLALHVVETRKTELGSDHLETSLVIGNLALTYVSQGRFEEAENLELQVRETRRIKLGADHPDNLISMNNLALIYWGQGRWEEAEKLEVQVMETRRGQLGADHPDTLASMHNLAFTWKSLGWSVKATNLMQQCVQRREVVLGAEHPHFKSSLSSLKKWEEEEADAELCDRFKAMRL